MTTKKKTVAKICSCVGRFFMSKIEFDERLFLKAESEDIPTKISELTNDTEFIPRTDVEEVKDVLNKLTVSFDEETGELGIHVDTSEFLYKYLFDGTEQLLGSGTASNGVYKTTGRIALTQIAEPLIKTDYLWNLTFDYKITGTNIDSRYCAISLSELGEIALNHIPSWYSLDIRANGDIYVRYNNYETNCGNIGTLGSEGHMVVSKVNENTVSFNGVELTNNIFGEINDSVLGLYVRNFYVIELRNTVLQYFEIEPKVNVTYAPKLDGSEEITGNITINPEDNTLNMGRNQNGYLTQGFLNKEYWRVECYIKSPNKEYYIGLCEKGTTIENRSLLLNGNGTLREYGATRRDLEHRATSNVYGNDFIKLVLKKISPHVVKIIINDTRVLKMYWRDLADISRLCIALKNNGSNVNLKVKDIEVYS